jgi:uncharacterized membrane protein
MPRPPKHDAAPLPVRRPAETGGGIVGAIAAYEAAVENGASPVLAIALAVAVLALPFVISYLADVSDRIG